MVVGSRGTNNERKGASAAKKAGAVLGGRRKRYEVVSVTFALASSAPKAAEPSGRGSRERQGQERGEEGGASRRGAAQYEDAFAAGSDCEHAPHGWGILSHPLPWARRHVCVGVLHPGALLLVAMAPL